MKDSTDDSKTTTARQELRREVIEFVKMVAWCLILFVVMRSYVLEGYEVQGPSMFPTLRDQERILVFKLPHVVDRWVPFLGLESFKDGDIVVFESPDDPGKRYVKRLIAHGVPQRSKQVVEAQPHQSRPPAETIRVRLTEGAVFVNNARLDEPYINNAPLDADHDIAFPAANDLSGHDQEVLLGPGSYYVLGDNRDVSKDSRKFGPITGNTIIGKAVFRFWPLDKAGFIQ